MAENGNAQKLECTLTTCHCFSVSFPYACACACVFPLYMYDATTQAQAQENGNRSIFLCLCLCLRRCVVRVNWNDATISTSANTRHLCLRRTGLDVGFLCLCLCLCLCLSRPCKPGFMAQFFLKIAKLLQYSETSPEIKVIFCYGLHP